jgi:glycosyltransferase involved in cell wall biosynthesis
LKVLHVDTARSWRGGQNQVLLTLLGMAERGHEVTLACRARGELRARAEAAGIATRPARFQGDLGPFGILALTRALRETRPDVMQLHDPHAVSAGLVARRLARSRARVIATRRVDFRLRSLPSRFKYRACDRVIAVSRAIADLLRADGLPDARIRLVYEGVPDRPPISGGREALAALGVPEGSPVVGNVAALTGHKDHATLIEATALLRERLPRVAVVIAGEGELRPALETQARALGLSGSVIFAGFRTDLDRLLPAFTVFCLSSHMEGLGTSLLDAMAFGRPVVATAAGGIPEAVEDGKTGLLVPPRDPRALADALQALLTDEARARVLGAAGRERFLARFSAAHMVEATLQTYAEGP